LSEEPCRRVTAFLLRWYRENPDPGVHGAIDWLLRHSQEGPEPRKLNWGQARALEKIDRELAGKPREGRQWSVNALGLTLVHCPKPDVFLMGSPSGELDRKPDEIQHRRRIGRSFAIASKLVTVRQFQQFLKENPQVESNYGEQYAPDLDCPINAVSWYTAAQFCRWLSDKEELPETEMCYPRISGIQKSKDGRTPLKLPADYLQRKGYRLPTEAEWEYACRAGTSTSRSFGVGLDLLPRYGWYLENSKDQKNKANRSWPVGQKRPNDFGLFDMHGNVWSWCQERYSGYREALDAQAAEDEEDSQDVIDSNGRVLRGGSFLVRPSDVRSAYRLNDRPTFRVGTIGLRPARTTDD
jgi:formylglycine-generating enzyme required for sulfatase activity